MTAVPDRLIRVGVVARPHGIRGELLVRLDVPGSRTLLDSKRLFLRAPTGVPELREFVSVRPIGQNVILRLPDVDDRTAAEGFAGYEVLLARDWLPATEEGEYYIADLVGLRVVGSDGVQLGRVKSVFDAGAAPVLEIAGEREWQVPLAEPFVKRVDIAAGELVVEPPEETEEVPGDGE